jgi:hypothetical protein
MADMTMTVIRTSGIVAREGPLSQRPYRVHMFGTQAKPEEREFVALSEVRAILDAVGAAAMRLADAAPPSEDVDVIRSVFAGPPPSPELPPVISL